MKVSQKGLYALQALIMLARHDDQGAIKIRDIAYEENLPEKFLELILVELKNARIVDSIRGAKGGYKLRRKPSDIHLSEIMRLIDGPLAPFGDADSLRALIASDDGHRAPRNGKKTRARASRTTASEARTAEVRAKEAQDSSGQAKILMLKERTS